MKKRIFVTVCMTSCMLALAGCSSTSADNTANMESVESTESIESIESTESIESVESTESMESVESTESIESVENTETGEATAWVDGTYTETATGKESNFEVTVVIRDGSIASVTIGDHQETPDKGGVAIAELPDKIVEAQSYDVDVVSGATITSTGIKEAVARALEQASN
ncbi:MAG: FMN-binding protein [Lachnospiraceae bacterium]